MKAHPPHPARHKAIILHQLVLALCLASMALLSQASPVAAFPPLPSGFWGTVAINGQNAPLGATVSAWIEGVRYAHTLTQEYQGAVVYSLDVPGDDPSTPAIEGGNPGDIIEFKIDGFPAQQSGVWQSGQNVPLDLTVDGLVSTYLPIVLR